MADWRTWSGKEHDGCLFVSELRRLFVNDHEPPHFQRTFIQAPFLVLQAKSGKGATRNPKASLRSA
jgi:hypothetical protein